MSFMNMRWVRFVLHINYNKAPHVYGKAQAHIHNKLIEKAKERLSTTRLTVSEVAYELGFEHPQSFNKLFKTNTKLSPLEFRQSFD